LAFLRPAEIRELGRRRVQIPLGDGVYEPSAAWHVAAVIVVLAAVTLVVAAFAVDLASGKPSSTTPVIIPFMALYAGVALAGLGVLDFGVRRLLRRRRSAR
jgi:hypothetical protein